MIKIVLNTLGITNKDEGFEELQEKYKQSQEEIKRLETKVRGLEKELEQTKKKLMEELSVEKRRETFLSNLSRSNVEVGRLEGELASVQREVDVLTESLESLKKVRTIPVSFVNGGNTKGVFDLLTLQLLGKRTREDSFLELVEHQDGKYQIISIVWFSRWIDQLKTVDPGKVEKLKTIVLLLKPTTKVSSIEKITNQYGYAAVIPLVLDEKTREITSPVDDGNKDGPPMFNHQGFQKVTQSLLELTQEDISGLKQVISDKRTKESSLRENTQKFKSIKEDLERERSKVRNYETQLQNL